MSDQKKFLEDITQSVQDYREDAMTIAQQLRQEGLRQGGHDKAFEIAKNLLGMGLDLNSIKQATKLSEEEINRLRERMSNRKAH